MRDLRRLGTAALELIWPTRCVGCERLGTLLCESCADALPFIDQTLACPRCGAPAGLLVCTECTPVYEPQSFAFAQARCTLEFSELTRRLIVAYKDGGERRLAPVLARLLAHAIPAEWRRWADALTWIPADARAFRRRGFDHMALLASALAEQIGLPAVSLLAKQVCADQRGLGRTQRAGNTSEVFSVRALPQDGCATDFPSHSRPGHLILIDDVFTTGATLDAAAHTLLHSHDLDIREVRVATVGRVW
jgi:predicted amidophosphoribosyltransferase